MAFIAAALTEKGHARLLALDCPPITGGRLSPGRLVVEADLPPGEYPGLWIEDQTTQENVTVILRETLGEGLHSHAFLEVRRGQ